MSTSSKPPPNLVALEAAAKDAYDKHQLAKKAKDAAEASGDTSLQTATAAAEMEAFKLSKEATKVVREAKEAAAGTGNPPNAANPRAASSTTKSEMEIIKRNLESLKTVIISNIGYDDDSKHSPVNVQQLVVIENSAKTSSPPDRIHDFIANILDRKIGSTKISNGNIYYLKKKDYAQIAN